MISKAFYWKEEHLNTMGGWGNFTQLTLYNIENKWGTMVFYELKSPQHQAELTSCIPTTLKTLFDNQFGIKLKIAKWKKLTKWTKTGGSPYGSIHALEQWLSEQKLQSFEKAGLKEKDLIELLEKKVLPYLYLRANYNDGKNKDDNTKNNLGLEHGFSF